MLCILYHSGVGSTKAVAYTLYQILREKTQVHIYNVEELQNKNLEEYHQFIIGFPTYHCSPSKTIQRFIQKLPPFCNKKPAFVFTTCGLYSGNTLRIFANMCSNKNLQVVSAKAYRCPASDGTLVWPWLSFLFSFQKDLSTVLARDIQAALGCLNSPPAQSKLPRFRLHSIPNYPNKVLAQRIKPKIYLCKDRCTRCGLCSKLCPYSCLDKDTDGFPVHSTAQCEHCYRCIHACPRQALTLKKGKPISKQLQFAALLQQLQKEYP